MEKELLGLVLPKSLTSQLKRALKTRTCQQPRSKAKTIEGANGEQTTKMFSRLNQTTTKILRAHLLLKKYKRNKMLLFSKKKLRLYENSE